jgi:hypothetical protein
MRLIISITMAIMSCGTVLFAGSIDVLGSIVSAENSRIKMAVPQPARESSSDGQLAEVRESAEAILNNPGAFTITQMGDMIERLDVVRSGMSISSRERKEFDDLRNAVDKAQVAKIRHNFGRSESADSSESTIKIDFEDTPENPFTVTPDMLLSDQSRSPRDIKDEMQLTVKGLKAAGIEVVSAQLIHTTSARGQTLGFNGSGLSSFGKYPNIQVYVYAIKCQGFVKKPMAASATTLFDALGGASVAGDALKRANDQCSSENGFAAPNWRSVSNSFSGIGVLSSSKVSIMCWIPVR